MYQESVILVVGDESNEPESIASMLADRYRIVEVETPEDAMTHVSDGVDSVISQLDSPEFSGLSLLRKWKARNKLTPFLFISEGNDVNSVVEGMKLGADDCFVRPINAKELRDAIGRLLAPENSAGDRSASDEPDHRKPNIDIPPGTSLEDLERAAVEQALAQHHGNRTHAARTLGISVRTLQRKLKAWGMPVLSSFRPNNAPSATFLYTEQVSPQTEASFSSHAL